MSENPAPTESSTFKSAYQLFVMVASAVVILFGMKYSAEIITPILLAFVLAQIFLPMETWLISKGWKPWLALVLTLVVMLLVLGMIVSAAITSIAQFINQIPEYEVGIESMVENALNWFTNLSLDNINLPFNLPEGFEFNLNFDPTQLINFENFDISSVVNLSTDLLGSVLGAIANTFSNWIVIALLIAFMLADFHNLDERLERAFKNSSQVETITSMTRSLRKYVSLTTYIGVLTGVVDAIFLICMGVDFAILWGLLGFLMNYIPNLGIWISIIPPTILAFLEFGWQRGLIVVIGFTLINNVLENVFKPKMMGDNLNISPLFIMISLVLWSFVLGPLGTILAIPMTLIITRLVLESSMETQWLAVLMSAQPQEEKHTRTWLERWTVVKDFTRGLFAKHPDPETKYKTLGEYGAIVKAFFPRVFTKKGKDAEEEEEEGANGDM
ncbi:MAG: AI-2E family transporter [Anaerolineae bacterium]|jgi:predicted PurR-regulated permease PerM|nr:AI-2E family transporter [Anaerolineae bacterium]